MSGAIYGPALPGENAPVLFDLGGAGFYPGSSLGNPPGYRFFSPFDGTFGAGPFTLTPERISQLQTGLWYVEITSFTMPEGQLRGQIVPVPEPSVGALMVLGGGVMVWLKRKKTWANKSGGANSRPASQFERHGLRWNSRLSRVMAVTMAGRLWLTLVFPTK